MRVCCADVTVRGRARDGLSNNDSEQHKEELFTAMHQTRRRRINIRVEKNTRIKTEKHLHKYRTEREMVGLVLVAFSVFSPFAAVGIVAPTSAFISSSPYLLSHCGHPVGCCCCGVPGKETGQTGNGIKQQHRPSGGRTEISPPKTNHHFWCGFAARTRDVSEGKTWYEKPPKPGGRKVLLFACHVCLFAAFGINS